MSTIPTYLEESRSVEWKLLIKFFFWLECFNQISYKKITYGYLIISTKWSVMINLFQYDSLKMNYN